MDPEEDGGGWDGVGERGGGGGGGGGRGGGAAGHPIICGIFFF